MGHQRDFDDLDAMLRVSRKDEQLQDPHVLHNLCLGQQLDLMLRLLDSDSSRVNWRNQNGLVPLHVAVVSAEPPCLEDFISFLLYYGADVDATCAPSGNTSLHMAVIFSKLFNAEISVPLLLREGANPLIRNFAGRTPRDYAMANGYLDLASLLLAIEEAPERRHEIDVYNWKEKFGANVDEAALLAAAIERGDAEGAGRICRRMLADGKSAPGSLHSAVQKSPKRQKAEMIASLLDAGADATEVDENGDTAMQLAIWSLPHDEEMLQVVRSLLQAGTPKKNKNKAGKDALVLAVERKYEDVEELLVGKPKPKQEKPRPKQQPQLSVHEVLNDKSLTTTKKLETLEQMWKTKPRPDPNERSKDGAEDTPLHVTVRRDQEKLTDFFLSKKASVNERNARRETPLLLAQRTEFGCNAQVYQKLQKANRRRVAKQQWKKLYAAIG